MNSYFVYARKTDEWRKLVVVLSPRSSDDECIIYSARSIKCVCACVFYNDGGCP